MIMGVFGTLTVVASFSVSFYYILSIQHSIVAIEEEMNSKFRKMFNSILDAVILLKDQKINFLNEHAESLLGQGEDRYHLPFLYLFSDAEQKENNLSRTKADEGKKLSIADILNLNQDTLSECVFTTSEAISQCKQMD